MKTGLRISLGEDNYGTHLPRLAPKALAILLTKPLRQASGVVRAEIDVVLVRMFPRSHPKMLILCQVKIYSYLQLLGAGIDQSQSTKVFISALTTVIYARLNSDKTYKCLVI